MIYSNESSRLFEIMLEANEQIAKFHLSLAKTENAIERAELKGKIAVFNTLLAIIDKRIDAVNANEADKTHKELITNRQFRMAAEVVLTKETFEKIKELSEMNYKKFKDSRAELKQNKLQ